jgi:hypothetical protein
VSYIGPGDLRQFLGMGDEPGYDELLERIIADAQALWDGETETTFEASTDTARTFDAARDVNGRTLYLRRDLAALAASNAVINGDGSTIAASEYTLQPLSGPPYRYIVLKDNSAVEWEYTTHPENAITVTGKWGYSTTAPTRVQTATRVLAAWMYRRKDQIGANYDTALVSPTNGAPLLPARDWPPEARAILKLYKPNIPGAGSRVVRGQLVNS